MQEIIEAFELLVTKNCLTLPEALERAYKSGHREAVKTMEPVSIIKILNDKSSPTGIDQSSK